MNQHESISQTNDPIQLFQDWILEAKKSQPLDYDAMTLATSSLEGIPAARIVLFKGMKGDCPTFYTCYSSQKGHELEINPRAVLVFHWSSLMRQIRIEGRTEKLSRAESEKYFWSRPKDAQISAVASLQSREIDQYSRYDQAVAALTVEFADKTVPCPQDWGGYALVPQKFEFWIGQSHRRHHRYVFFRDHATSPAWKFKMLYP